MNAPVRIVESHLVHKDSVEADGLKTCRLLHRAQIVAVAVAQRENRTARTEGLLPEVRKRSSHRLRVNNNRLSLRRLRNEKYRDEQGEHCDKSGQTHLWGFHPLLRSRR